MFNIKKATKKLGGRAQGFNSWIPGIGFLLLQRFSVGLAVEYSSCFIWVFLIYMFAVLCGPSRPSRGPNNLYVYEAQQNLERGL